MLEALILILAGTNYEFIIIIALLLYIIYLQLQVVKKNALLKEIYEKIDRPNSKLEKEDIVRYLDNIKKPEYSKLISKDKFLDEKVQKFIFEKEDEIKAFVHYTASENIAMKIIVEGFRFVNSFYKTAEYIYHDELYLLQRHHEHKQFGDFVVVIGIAKKTYDHYTDELRKIKAKNIASEQILTEHTVEKDENYEDIYTLPIQFVKGYFNYKDGTIVRNPSYNHKYKSASFEKNLLKIKEELSSKVL